MIIQIQGGEGVTVNTPENDELQFGQISGNINNLGKFEFNFITAFADCGKGQVIIYLATALTNNYITDDISKYQVVQTVYCVEVTIPVSFSCTPWDGEKGGVISIEANKLTFLPGVAVNCSAAGFQGGNILPTDCAGGPSPDLGCSEPRGGAKGESCVANPNYQYCRGAYGTGGGGSVCVMDGEQTGYGAAGGSFIGKNSLFFQVKLPTMIFMRIQQQGKEDLAQPMPSPLLVAFPSQSER